VLDDGHAALVVGRSLFPAAPPREGGQGQPVVVWSPSPAAPGVTGGVTVPPPTGAGWTGSVGVAATIGSEAGTGAG